MKSFHNKFMVGLGRLELPTSPLSGVRSNQLSYRPTCVDGASYNEKTNFVTFLKPILLDQIKYKLMSKLLKQEEDLMPIMQEKIQHLKVL